MVARRHRRKKDSRGPRAIADVQAIIHWYRDLVLIACPLQCFLGPRLLSLMGRVAAIVCGSVAGTHANRAGRTARSCGLFFSITADNFRGAADLAIAMRLPTLWGRNHHQALCLAPGPEFGWGPFPEARRDRRQLPGRTFSPGASIACCINLTGPPCRARNAIRHLCANNFAWEAWGCCGDLSARCR